MKKKKNAKSENIEKFIGEQAKTLRSKSEPTTKAMQVPPYPGPSFSIESFFSSIRSEGDWEKRDLPVRIHMDNEEFRGGAAVLRRMRKLISPVAGKKTSGPAHGS